MNKRGLFQELMDGVGDMADQREGKITLKQYDVEAKPAPKYFETGSKPRLNPMLRQRF